MNIPVSIKKEILHENCVNINGKIYNREKGYVPSEIYTAMLKTRKYNEIERIAAKELKNVISEQYSLTVNYYRNKVKHLYGDFITFTSDTQVMRLAVKIKQIMKNNNMKMSEMINDVKEFLGYNFNMKRYTDSNTSVPIEPERIEQAYAYIKNTKAPSFLEVENILSF